MTWKEEERGELMLLVKCNADQQQERLNEFFDD